MGSLSSCQIFDLIKMERSIQEAKKNTEKHPKYPNKTNKQTTPKHQTKIIIIKNPKQTTQESSFSPPTPTGR